MSGESANETQVEVLVKIHGMAMTVSWGLVVPLGISLSLMCKSVCPGKAWFISHVVVMMLTLLITAGGLAAIVWHAGGKWLTTQELNWPHQLLGILAAFTIGVNPCIGLFKPRDESKWRSLFNVTHGGVGFFLGFLPACGAMLIGVHLLEGLTSAESADVRLTSYFASALVGYVIFMLAVFNIYPLRYHKAIPRPHKLPLIVHDMRNQERERNLLQLWDSTEEDEEELKELITASPDSVCRVIAMGLAFIPVVGLVVAMETNLARLT